MPESWEIREGKALDELRSMESDSVDCCVTSPPYWRMRDYGHDDQLGMEEELEDAPMLNPGAEIEQQERGRIMKTKIEWAGHNWNLSDGCTPAGPGCLHCYAAAIASRNMSPTHVGLTRKAKRRNETGQLVSLPVFNGAVEIRPERLLEPLSRRTPTRFFVDSMSDFFHESIPNEYRAAALGVMAVTPQHTYLLLTKRDPRPFYAWLRAQADREHGRHYDVILPLAADYAVDKRRWEKAVVSCGFDQNFPEFEEWPLPNVHIGGSAANQARFDLHTPRILGVNARVNWMSLEPLIGPIDMDSGIFLCPDGHEEGTHVLDGMLWCRECGAEMESLDPTEYDGLDWIVVGGESGPGARPCHIDWIRSIVEQCKGGPTRVFVKQLGAHVIGEGGKRIQLTDAKGKNMAEWPEDLRVREYPAGEREE